MSYDKELAWRGAVARAVNPMRDQGIMSDDIFIDTILEAQAIVARHIAGEHASAEETIAKLMQLLDSTELVKALAKRGYSSKAFE
jgi:mannitol/fructose-specific phosphotransferase system IIA component (Ntr-type)